MKKVCRRLLLHKEERRENRKPTESKRKQRETRPRQEEKSSTREEPRTTHGRQEEEEEDRTQRGRAREKTWTNKSPTEDPVEEDFALLLLPWGPSFVFFFFSAEARERAGPSLRKTKLARVSQLHRGTSFCASLSLPQMAQKSSGVWRVGRGCKSSSFQ